jgi:MoaA/NifB/PqqE/SkfB family radical SAM enzyme
MKRSSRFKLKLRELNMVLQGIVSTKHPLLAHIIPTRRCNLSCGYCNEYDDFSPPIPTDTMLRRIDLLAGLRTAVVTMSGGEPLLHPEVEAIIRRIRHHGMISGIITNGYLLTPKKIQALNDAGLEHLQISIDNIQPDDVSMKSLKVLDKKLEFLAEHAEFSVNINSVIGGGIKNPRMRSRSRSELLDSDSRVRWASFTTTPAA